MFYNTQYYLHVIPSTKAMHKAQMETTGLPTFKYYNSHKLIDSNRPLGTDVCQTMLRTDEDGQSKCCTPMDDISNKVSLLRWHTFVPSVYSERLPGTHMCQWSMVNVSLAHICAIGLL